MYSRVNYALVGLFVLLFGAGAVLFSFWLAKYGFKQEYDLYRTYFQESVSGLTKDATVKLHGVNVGRVKQIAINPSNVKEVEVLLEIEHNTPIKSDMVAQTTMLGVTGLLSVEITGGSNEALTLHPSNRDIPTIPSKPSWVSKTKTQLQRVGEDLAQTLTQTQKLLSDENIAKVEAILAHTEKLTAKGEGFLDDANRSLQHFNHAVLQLEKKMDDVTALLERIGKKSIPAIDTFAKTAQNFNRVTLKVERSLDRGDYNVKKIFEPMIVEMEILTDQINALTKELQESPSDIFFKSRQQRRGPGE